MTNKILEMHNITKFFPGVKALDNVNFSVEAGEIHALVGENGAGKSTLMKILSGEYPHGSYSGAFFFNGKECKFRDINESVEEGIAIIHQEFALVPFLSIAENIFLGNERAMNGVINWTETNRKAKELLEMVGLHEAPTRLVANLGAGKQQLVEIAKALSKEVKLLILDEPTASLNETDSDALLDLLLQIKGQGISSIFISHKLSDVSKIADSLTILRDGKTIETLDYKRDQVTEDRVIRGMVGRDLTHRFPPRASQIGEVIFEVKNWNVYDPYIDDRKMIKDVSLNVRQGEVLGIAGLMGSGRTELAMSIFGRAYGRNISGKAYKRGQEVDISTIEKAIKNGIVYVTEDRKNYGLILMQDIKKNITLTNLDAITEHGRVNESKEFVVANQFRDRFDIKCTSILQKTVNLSGGNQQKVMLSKWLFADPDILILDEPTRGIDVGAKYEIYTNINNLVAEGKAIILISSELPELLGICDRIYVMNEGSIVGEMPVSEASQEKIMKCIMVSQEVREQ